MLIEKAQENGWEEAGGARQEQESTFSSFFGCTVVSVPQPGVKAGPP